MNIEKNTFRCDICDYVTIHRTALYTHNNTKKHHDKIKSSQNINKINIGDLLKENDNLRTIINEKEQDFTTKIKEYEKIINDKNKEIEKLTLVNEIYKNNKTTNNINTVNYIINNYNTTPPLDKINNFIIDGINADDDALQDEFIQKVIYYYKNKSLHKLIGDHIVINYKKQNIKEQSFHATDVARCNYLVKLKGSSKNNSFWKKDNGGKKLSYLLFEPTINFMVNKLKKKCSEYNNYIMKSNNNIPTKKEFEKFEVLNNILRDIDTDKIKNKTNKYVAPYFDINNFKI